MKLALVGIGNAGSRIVNRILHNEQATGRNLTDGNTVLINTTRPTFDTSAKIPDERRLLIGDVHHEVQGEEIDGDPELGAEVAREDHSEILRLFDAIEFGQVDGMLVVGGLAGGTGGGAGAVVIEQVASICDEPVYGLGVLPHETEGSEAALNAARSLQSFVSRADNVLAFDNDAWLDDETARAADFEEVNEELAVRIVTLFAAGEWDGGIGPENRMDPSDIMRTLATGGVSTIGYAATDVPRTGGYFSWLWSAAIGRLPWTANDAEEEPTNAAKINSLVRRATHSQLTLPCDVSSAERALIMLSGPSEELSRKGFESGRYWLEQEADTVEVMAGDEPHAKARKLTATILFSNVTSVPRIDSIQAQGVSVQETTSGGIVFENEISE